MGPESIVKDVKKTYTRLAFVYDVWVWFTERKSLYGALKLASVQDGEAILEVAVGTGLMFREILKRNPSGRNFGIDLTESMLNRARLKAEKTGVPFDLKVGDAQKLSFGDSSFDLVVNNNMFGLVPEEEFGPILKEFFRVLRPGGRLLIVTMKRPKGLIAGWIYQIGAIWLGGWRDIQLESFVRTVGFEQVSREIAEQLGIPSEILLARKV